MPGLPGHDSLGLGSSGHDPLGGLDMHDPMSQLGHGLPGGLGDPVSQLKQHLHDAVQQYSQDHDDPSMDEDDQQEKLHQHAHVIVSITEQILVYEPNDPDVCDLHSWFSQCAKGKFRGHPELPPDSHKVKHPREDDEPDSDDEDPAMDDPSSHDMDPSSHDMDPSSHEDMDPSSHEDMDPSSHDMDPSSHHDMPNHDDPSSHHHSNNHHDPSADEDQGCCGDDDQPGGDDQYDEDDYGQYDHHNHHHHNHHGHQDYSGQHDDYGHDHQQGQDESYGDGDGDDYDDGENYDDDDGMQHEDDDDQGHEHHGGHGGGHW
ncbi:hypothetical protein AYO20_05579 [Fonsecaea nubica]|uniref:Uncharacterized protein n=1 Tax=Fonsecaea nubica TaxID=856822 RepID=A0A178D0T5_9EURO|nr:hypothetical protein AYO20_05579 [Fonsecaea nubica]OAL35102.1 hypothetical protein AYO20_05579 [Fonsecaea nubica]